MLAARSILKTSVVSDRSMSIGVLAPKHCDSTGKRCANTSRIASSTAATPKSVENPTQSCTGSVAASPLSKTAKSKPVAGDDSGSAASHPAMADNIKATSSTVRAIGPSHQSGENPDT